MKKAIPFEIDGEPIFIEIDDSTEVEDIPSGQSGPQFRERKRGEDKTRRFVEAVERVKPAAEAVLKTFKELNTPGEIALEFGVKFNAKAGAILASVDSEATFKVSLKWTNRNETQK